MTFLQTCNHEPQMLITVKTREGVLTCELEGENPTVKDLKNYIQENHGHPATSQVIVFGGNACKDDFPCKVFAKEGSPFLVIRHPDPKQSAFVQLIL